MAYAPEDALVRHRLTELGSLVVPKYRDRLWWYHRAIAEALEGLLRYVRFRGEQGGYARVSISMPPQHGKSLHGTELLPAFALGLDPDLKIICASNGATLARKGIGHCRQWMGHDDYKRVFATRFGKVEEFEEGSGRRLGVKEAPDTSLFFRTLKPRKPGSTRYAEAGGYYLAQGLGGSITGWGYDLGIMDDLVKNAEQALSSAHHSKLWDFYTSTFATRATSDRAGQLYIGTRWTSPDFADELVDYWQSQSGSDNPLPIKVLRFPALADGEVELCDVDPRADEAFVSEYGAGLDNPIQRKERYYTGERSALLSRRPWVWFGMYQQFPRMAGTKFFQPEDWVPFGETFDMVNMLDYVDISIDANLSETGSSFAVITVAGIVTAGEDDPNPGEHFFLLDEARGHWSYDELESEFLRLWKKWYAALPSQTREGSVWVENKALGPTLINKFQGDYPIVAVPKAKAKIYCYRVAAQVTGQNRVRIPKGTWGQDPTNPMLPLVTDEWVGDANTQGSWVHEQASHPSKPDDRRDALAQLIICRTSHLGIDILKAS